MGISVITLNDMSLMIQGTGSDAGKSLICAALIRAFCKAGLKALPFKPQNMSNNAAVVQGGEIGRAQALQAQAASVEGSVDMNPVLLKPQGQGKSQIIVQGKYWGESNARDYYKLKPKLLPFVEESFERIKSACDIVIVEGAGSPSEVNLRDGDIANMGFAVHFGVPVVLLGDIERGGVIANLVGTYHLLEAAERELIKGFLINKFRGDVSLFDSALGIIEAATGWAGLGVIPWLEEAKMLPQEDSMGMESIKRDTKKSSGKSSGKTSIGVLRLQHIANFDDLDALRAESAVRLQVIEAGEVIPSDLDCLIIPGSKATIADYRFLCDNGWDIDIKAFARQGGIVLGLCGGYQMLGNAIHDKHGLEGTAERIETLKLLDMETVLTDKKQLSQSTVKETLFNNEVKGYEIHLGQSQSATEEIFLKDDEGNAIGYMNRTKNIYGGYLHGLFHNDVFRRNFLTWLGSDEVSITNHAKLTEDTLDKLADHIRAHCDLEKLLEIAKD